MQGVPWPADTERVIDAIRNTIGRQVVFNIIVSSTTCPQCHLDPATNTSDNSFCPVCHGDYYIPVISGVPVSGVVFWGKSDKPKWYPGGTLLDGDVVIQVKIVHEVLLERLKNIEVDGRVVEVKAVETRGVPVPNRILLYCKEVEHGD